MKPIGYYNTVIFYTTFALLFFAGAIRLTIDGSIFAVLFSLATIFCIAGLRNHVRRHKKFNIKKTWTN